MRYRDVLLSVELQADLSPVLADRVQLQQVMLNLMMNGAEAMSEVSERPRTLLVKSEAESTGAVVVSVEDSPRPLSKSEASKARQEHRRSREFLAAEAISAYLDANE